MKRLFAHLLVLALLLAVPFHGAALTAPQKIKALHEQFAEQISCVELDGSFVEAEQLSALGVHAGSELRVYLTGRDGSLFLDQNGLPVPTADVTLSRLRAARISLEIQDEAAQAAVESVEFAYSHKTEALPSASPYIQIRFVEDFVSVEDSEFSFEVGLSIAGELQQQTVLSLTGLMQVTEVELPVGSAEADIGDGSVVRAAEDRESVLLQLGEEVTIQAAVSEGEKYYGVAKLEEQRSESGAADTGGEVLKIYSLQSVNLDRPGNQVRIHSDITLHVYNAQGRWVGTTRDALVYSERYYLINQKMERYLPNYI